MKTVIYPRISEKAYALVAQSNTYVFNVPTSSNKLEITKTIEEIYSVKVKSVKIVNTDGKVKRSVKKGGKQIRGQRQDYKKAYVRLNEGQTIPVFAKEDDKESK